MNRSGIEWTDYSLTVITGCKRLCDFTGDGKVDCYAYKMANRFHRSFDPTFFPEKLRDLDAIRIPARIFVCPTSDFFAPWIPTEWRDVVLRTVLDRKYKHLTFQFLTKYPDGIPSDVKFPKNVWVGATITRQDEDYRFLQLCLASTQVRFLSLEPLLSHIDLPDFPLQWLIVGRLTGAKAPFKMEWVDDLVQTCRNRQIPLFIKNNVGYRERVIQEFPNMF